jgi:hypothetical protein
MTLKMKIWKAMVKQFFTKNRYTGNHPKWQKRILVGFLIVVNAFVGTVAYSLLPDMSFTFGETMVFVREASASSGAGEAPMVTPEESGNATENSGVREGEGSKGSSLERKILDAFPEDGMNALRVADCESEFDPTRIGDTHLGFFHEGETLGYSYGVFQIRSGGNENGVVWSRPEKAGISVDEWEEKMLDEDENIAEARRIYDESGGNWGKWTCGNKI